MIKHGRSLSCIWILGAALVMSSSSGARPAAQTPSPDCGNPNDLVADDEALQGCLDRGGIIELEPGYPGYIVNGLKGDQNRGLWLTQPGTILTSRSKSAKATIVAGRDLFGTILRTPPDRDVNSFVIDGVDFNGLGDTLLGDEPYRRHRDECGAAQMGNNVLLRGRGFAFRNNVVENALCGSGLALYGSFDVRQNYIASNGRDQPAADADIPFADGITVVYCEGGYIGSNFLIDNTDIDLVIGGGHGCVVEFNTIAHFRKFSVSGMNVGNFDGPGAGDHTDSQYRYNTIYAVVPNRMGMGLSVGSHMWDASREVPNAGRVFANTVFGGNINLVVDGVYGGEVSDNSVHDPSQDGQRECGHTGLDYTVFPPHVIDTIVQDGWVELRYDRDWCGDDSASSAARSQSSSRAIRARSFRGPFAPSRRAGR